MRLLAFPVRYVVGTTAPHVSGGWSLNRITMLFLVALVLPLGLVVVENGFGFLPLLGFALFVTLAWNIVFARVRRQPIVMDWAVSAISFALIVPPDLPLWQLGLSLSFGIVIGEQIFGGRGRNFLNPAIVALAFVAFSFPGTAGVHHSDLFALAVLPGAVLLVATGLISWRVLAGALLALACVVGFARLEDPFTSVMAGPLVFMLVFFACDPVCAASTNPGRWIYGALVGLLIGLFGLPGEVVGAPTVLVFSILLASVFAPLIDYFVVSLNAYGRRRRDG